MKLSPYIMTLKVKPLSSPICSSVFTMRPIDDVWSDISNLPSPTTNRFQDFFPLALRPPADLSPSPTTMLTLLTTTNSDHQDPNKRPKPNPPPRTFTAPSTANPPEYTEKFRRLMKNRESAARSRARKQARANELEHEVMRLAKENARLKRLQREVRGESQVPKESRLYRTKSAPF